MSTHSAILAWHKGPAGGGEGTAGKDENGAPLFYNDDRLLLIIETNKGREIAVVDIDCDEDYFDVRDAPTGEKESKVMKQKPTINPRLENKLKERRRISRRLMAFQRAEAALRPFEQSEREVAIKALAILWNVFP